jgi:cell wall-associated NlpC family hydrolase
VAPAAHNHVGPYEPVFAVPAFVRPGDILFCDTRNYFGGHSIPGWDHAAIYAGNECFIEAVPNEGVWITSMAIYQTWAKRIRYARVVRATTSQREAAIAFARSQLGKPYQPEFNRIKDPSPDSEEWYCSELVWAAYYNQGIDLDSDGGLSVWPSDIAESPEVAMYPSSTPETPPAPSGPTRLSVMQPGNYTALGVDRDLDELYYQWDWGNYQDPWPLLWRDPGIPEEQTHAWLLPGSYPVRVRVRDWWGNVSAWSDPLIVTVSLGGD